jgi:pyruvate/2-oxoglutarate dehydrogenase complex dihydrolipoamide acyltransferase (E2) component
VELHYYRVSAPMDGIVGDIPVRVGDRVGVTTLLTTVDEPGALEAYIYVPADRARNLRMGVPVYLVDDTGKKLADSHITFISPEVDPETQTVLAKATVENSQGRLRVSQQVRAQVVWKMHEGTVIPNQRAILCVPGGAGRKRDGRAAKADPRREHGGERLRRARRNKARRSHHHFGIAIPAGWRAGDGTGTGRGQIEFNFPDAWIDCALIPRLRRPTLRRSEAKKSRPAPLGMTCSVNAGRNRRNGDKARCRRRQKCAR